MPDPTGPNGPVAFTIVWRGRFDRTRLSNYLASLSKSQEEYAGHTIYSIPSSQGYTDRVALIGYDTVATSNTPTAEQIHSIIDRHLTAASPFSGSSLLSARYRDVPAFSPAWAVGHLGLAFVESGRINVFGVDLPLAPQTTFVASLRYVPTLNLHGNITLEIDQIAASEKQAADSAHALTQLLALASYMRQAQQPDPLSAADVTIRDFMKSIEIEQHKDRAVLTATLPVDTLKSLTAH